MFGRHACLAEFYLLIPIRKAARFLDECEVGMKTHPPVDFFRPAELAGPEGLLAVGGQLSPDWLIYAYRHGIFPWPIDDDLLAWWSPDPRAVLDFDALHVSRRLARTIRSGRFELSIDRDFAGVVHGCATAQLRWQATWLTRPMMRAYQRLHELGFGHSVETWYDGQLAGGVYGVSIGAAFAAESMFFYRRDASKVALVALVRHLRCRGYRLIDIQQRTPHTARMGGREIPRDEYLARLSAAIGREVTFGDCLEGGDER